MDTTSAALCLEALGNPTRLALYRLLVRAGHEGAVVGTVQEHLGIPGSTLTHHLTRLVHTGLASQERQGRHLICRAVYPRMNALLAYLSDNCCGGLEGESCAVDSQQPGKAPGTADG
ncbi:MAG: metalloregulator ArsR/SmtB family transcription factor [Deltaproteobacteria bacterium]|nr:metalloregulator ArsR/SmtB family transcription factor [Deltaproteobacteria bacterium]